MLNLKSQGCSPRRSVVSILTRKGIVTLLLLLIGLFALPAMTMRASGQLVGLVCLAPQGVIACPAPPVTIGGTVGSQLMVSVVLQGSDVINGFDVTLKANPSILKPVDADTTGSLLSGGSIIVKCIGGVLKSGPTCLSTDTSDTIHLAVVVGFFTGAPTTGLLFTAVYNVTGSANTSIGYQTGCSPSSVSGTNICVDFTNGTFLPVPENVQDATYTLLPTPTFTLSATYLILSINKRFSFPDTITVTSVNGFDGTVSLTAAISPVPKHSPSFSFNPSTVTLSSGGSATSILTVSVPSNATQGNYVLTVTGVGGTESASIQISLSVIP